MMLYSFFKIYHGLSNKWTLKDNCQKNPVSIAIIFPCGRADLIASALLRGIRSEGPRHHPSRLASAAILAGE